MKYKWKKWIDLALYYESTFYGINDHKFIDERNFILLELFKSNDQSP